MAHIDIFVGSVAYNNGNVRTDGFASCSDASDQVTWVVEYAFGAPSATKNAAIRDAAIAAAEAAGHNIGVLDNKTLYAGAMGV